MAYSSLAGKQAKILCGEVTLSAGGVGYSDLDIHNVLMELKNCIKSIFGSK